METTRKTRTVDPGIATRRSRVAGLTAQGAAPEVIEQARRELDEANRLAAIKSAVRNAPPLKPEVLGSIVATLAAAVVDD